MNARILFILMMFTASYFAVGQILKPNELGAENRSLSVVDMETHEPINFSVLLNGNVLASNVQSYTIDNAHYNDKVEIKSTKHFSTFVHLNEVKKEEHVVELNPLKKGKSIKLEHVYFERSSTSLKHSSTEDLMLVYEMLVENPNTKIIMKGHTDNQGDPIANKRLSQARVKVLKSFLLGQGIAANRIRSIGYGGEKPLVSNDTEENRELNRRVEFQIIEN